jgi:hypothetical protein
MESTMVNPTTMPIRPLAVSIDEAARILAHGAAKPRTKNAKNKWRPGRSSINALIKRGLLEAVRDGTRVKVTMVSIEKRLAALPRIAPRSTQARDDGGVL